MRFYFTLAMLLATHFSFSQNIPSGKCGLRYSYDNAGRVVAREYICAPITGRVQFANVAEKPTLISDSAVIQEIEAIYPNPTDGKFAIRFTIPLSNAVITVITLEGRIIDKFSFSGQTMTYDLSVQPAGIYFINITDKNIKLSMQKIVKQ